MTTLQNEHLKVSIHPKGAELQSLQCNGIEYMWSGDAAYWGKYSPILFPIVGTLKNDTYYYKGNTYSLPRHGFARDREFVATQISETEAVFTLEDDDVSEKVYPFIFLLQVYYRIDGSRLECKYKVTNPGGEELLFSVGGHPAFAVPNMPGTVYEDYFLQFNKQEPLNRWLLQDGLTSHTTPVSTEGDRLWLTPSLFNEDAIVLKHIQSDEITLRCSKHEHGLTFTGKNFPFWGIWAAPGAPFVCIEPWCGITDSVSHNQQLQDKEGIITLAPAGVWENAWQVKCF